MTTAVTAPFAEAVRYAAEVHADQRRKGARDVPYIGHLLGVCGLVVEDGGDEAESIAALLHDAAEDHGGRTRLTDIRTRFGERVASIVEGCSDTLDDPKPPWWIRKTRYVAHLEDAPPSVLRVSIADKVYNLASTVADLRVSAGSFWERFNAGPADQLWYYGSLVDVFRRRAASERLVPEMDRLVSELLDLVNADPPQAAVMRPMRPVERTRVESLVRPFLLNMRWREHESGATTFVVAWLADEPVGSIVVRWRSEGSEFDGLPAAAVVEGLEVAEQRRSQGLGSAMMTLAERLASARGHDRVVLSVALDNPGARRLYERLGYTDLGLGPRLLSWTFTDDAGVERTEGDMCAWLGKRLEDGAS
jgi:ribosomal protein S18 acetylase RimI-like enzyme